MGRKKKRERGITNNIKSCDMSGFSTCGLQLCFRRKKLFTFCEIPDYESVASKGWLNFKRRC